jgi:nucleotide-binding universal stress UspA family protein
MTTPGAVVIRRILAAVDFSPCSDEGAHAAVALARHFDARLLLLHVVRRAAERAAALDRLGAFAEARADGVAFTAAVAVGRAAAEIVRFAESEHVDLIVMGTHGRTGLAHVVMGSVAEAVVRRAPSQVLTIRPAGRQRADDAPPARGPAAATEAGHCLVCARSSADRICEACAARIRGEALERMLDDEKAGRTP